MRPRDCCGRQSRGRTRSAATGSGAFAPAINSPPSSLWRSSAAPPHFSTPPQPLLSSPVSLHHFHRCRCRRLGSLSIPAIPRAPCHLDSTRASPGVRQASPSPRPTIFPTGAPSSPEAEAPLRRGPGGSLPCARRRQRRLPRGAPPPPEPVGRSPVA